jgi:hypothetical protein
MYVVGVGSGGGGEGGEPAAKHSSPAIQCLTKPMQQAVNLPNVSVQNLHKVSLNRHSGVQMTEEYVRGIWHV